MPPTHIRWGKIALLHNVVRTLNILHTDLGQALPVVRYRAKVKLHGANVGVQVTDEDLFAQSRSTMLSPGDDYKGFAQWLADNRDLFADVAPGTTVFGEWCGPGVERGMAVSALPDKLLVVFALQLGRGAEARIIAAPDQIRAHLGEAGASLPVLPWQGEPVTLDFSDEADLEAQAEAISQRVAAVEREDPFIRQAFGVSGLGEGLVFYPEGLEDAEPLFSLMFKAKGDKHRTAGRAPAQPKAVRAEGVSDFVQLVVTEARLQQGVAEACGGTPHKRHTGAFLRWIAQDTRQESVAELEAAGLRWEQVDRAVQDHARKWLHARC